MAEGLKRILAMRTSLFFLLVLVPISLSGCSTCGPGTAEKASHFLQKQQVTTTTNDTYPRKNPQKIALYNKDQQPHMAYKIIGKATVSKTNLMGVKREETTLHEMMKNLAASIGGDGLIDVNHQEDSIEANVIAFQKILI